MVQSSCNRREPGVNRGILISLAGKVSGFRQPFEDYSSIVSFGRQEHLATLFVNLSCPDQELPVRRSSLVDI